MRTDAPFLCVDVVPRRNTKALCDLSRRSSDNKLEPAQGSICAGVPPASLANVYDKLAFRVVALRRHAIDDDVRRTLGEHVFVNTQKFLVASLKCQRFHRLFIGLHLELNVVVFWMIRRRRHTTQLLKAGMIRCNSEKFFSYISLGGAVGSPVAG